MPMNPRGGAVYTEIQHLASISGHAKAFSLQMLPRRIQFAAFIAPMHDIAASETGGFPYGTLFGLAGCMMSIAFSAPRLNFIWIGGNLPCKSNHGKIWPYCRLFWRSNQRR
jgi:hypothetical protein